MSLTDVDLGDFWYLYHPGHDSTNLIITAHGKHVNKFSSYKMTFQLPRGKQLHFYTPNHKPMADWSLLAVANGNQPEYDKDKYIGPRQCANYRLYFYDKDIDQDYRNAGNSAVLNYPDIVVVKDTSLSDILSTIQTNYHTRYDNYTDIHCSFCRVGYQWLAYKLTPRTRAPRSPAFESPF